MKKPIIFTLLAALALSCFSSCGDATENAEVEVWSTYNTVKVLQSGGEYEKQNARLNISMARGETEGAQIILTPDRDVKSFELKKADLKNADGDVLPADSAELYVQKYIHVDDKTYNQDNQDYPEDCDVPDMLLYMETAKAFGENTIEAGKNQGITVEYTTTSETKPGTYTGVYTLIVDGTERNIPVSVTVWDIDVTKSYGKTCFYHDNNVLMQGEMDGSLETYRTYYETMLEYKTCLFYLPNANYSAEGFVDDILLYWDHPSFTSYGIPLTPGYGANEMNASMLKLYLYAVAKASKPGKNLFDKAYYYNVLLDEPNDNPEKMAKLEDAITVITRAEEEVCEKLKAEGFFDAFPAEFEEELTSSIRNIDQVITTPYSASLNGYDMTYCPPIQYYDSETARDTYAYQAELVDGEEWWYTCMQPVYPYPSHHIDDYLLSGRVMRWMQKAYNVSGYLYWSVGLYFKRSSGNLVLADPYNDPVRFENVRGVYNGDGFLLYPGKKYGLDKPIPTVRLSALRDGQEDMDLLYALENKYKEKASYYGIPSEEVNINVLLSNEYDELFTGVVPVTDSALFYSVREKTAAVAGQLDGEENLLVTKIEKSGTRVYTEFYVDGRYEVSVNGRSVFGTKAGNGYRYEYTIEMDKTENYVDIAMTRDGKTSEWSYYAGAMRKRATRFGEYMPDGTVAVSEGSVLEFGDGFAEALLRSVRFEDDLIQTMQFRPGIEISTSIFDKDVSELSAIEFTLTNLSDEDVNLKVIFESGNETYTYGNIVVGAGASQKVSLANLNLISSAALKGNGKLLLSVDNIRSDGSLYSDRWIRVSDIYYTEA